MRKHILCGLCLPLITLTACSTSGPEPRNPDLAPRGTTMTTARPSRQDLANKVSMTGKVAMNPVFGLVSPAKGQVRYLDVKPPTSTPTKPTRVAGVWADGRATHVEVPAGATFTGRLVDDRSTVTAGMPIVSAKYAGYGVVAEINGEQAYKINDGLTSVQAQVKNGPGPFPCAVLGTIAALPPGTIPDPPAPPQAAPPPSGQASAPPSAPPAAAPKPGERGGGPQPSEATGLRLVCTAPADVKLINGADATIEVVTERASGVLVVPVEAVAGTQGKGKVDVLGADGLRQTKDVELGITDGRVVQVKSGLTGNETLAVPGPNLPPGPAGANGPGGPGGPGK